MNWWELEEERESDQCSELAPQSIDLGGRGDLGIYGTPPLGIFMDIHEYSDTTGEGGGVGLWYRVRGPGSWGCLLLVWSLFILSQSPRLCGLSPLSWIPSNCLPLGRPASDPSRELKSSPCHHFFSFGPSDLLAVSLLLHPWKWRLAL